MKTVLAQKKSVIGQLIAEPQHFDFFQAVRLVEQNFISKLQANLQGNFFKEHMRFRATANLHFPISPISHLKIVEGIKQNQPRLEIYTSFFGLFGPNGLLPQHYTEFIIQRLQLKDNAFRDFLDLFNHRIISLFYQSWEKHHFFVGYEKAKQGLAKKDALTNVLDSLVGNGLPALQNRLKVADDVLLYYAGYFASQHRSAVNLQNMLSDYFGVKVDVIQFQGKWLTIAKNQRTRLIPQQGYNQLGCNTIIGWRAWNCQYHFRLRIGPLSYRQFQQFLPNGNKLAALISLTRRYIGVGLTFEIQLILNASEVPSCTLSQKDKTHLGWNSWLKSRQFNKNADDAIFNIHDFS